MGAEVLLTREILEEHETAVRTAILKEREACAKIAERYPVGVISTNIAAAIRARP